MFISRKKKQFIYTILYLLPFILFIVYYFSSFNAFSVDVSFSEIQARDILLDLINAHYFPSFLDGMFYPIWTFISDYGIEFFPITYLFNFIFDGYIIGEAYYNFLYGISFYFDYCIWLSVSIIAFDVITFIPVIAHKFVHRLSGVNE